MIFFFLIFMYSRKCAKKIYRKLILSRGETFAILISLFDFANRENLGKNQRPI